MVYQKVVHKFKKNLLDELVKCKLNRTVAATLQARHYIAED